MKQKNLKTIFAVAALSLGVVMPLADANAGPVVVFPASESSERHLDPWDAGYELELKTKNPEKYKTFLELKAVISDPSKSAGDIKEIMDGEWFGMFSPSAAKYIEKAREEVLRGSDVEANNAQVLRMMRYMRGCKAAADMGRSALVALGLAGLVGWGAWRSVEREYKGPRP